MNLLFSVLGQNAGVYQANYQSHSRRQSKRPSPTSNNSSIYLKKQHENTFHKSTWSRFEPNISRTGLANYYYASLLFNRHHTVKSGTAVTPYNHPWKVAASNLPTPSHNQTEFFEAFLSPYTHMPKLYLD
jgi:hypothetical protein